MFFSTKREITLTRLIAKRYFSESIIIGDLLLKFSNLDKKKDFAVLIHKVKTDVKIKKEDNYLTKNRIMHTTFQLQQSFLLTSFKYDFFRNSIEVNLSLSSFKGRDN